MHSRVRHVYRYEATAIRSYYLTLLGECSGVFGGYISDAFCMREARRAGGTFEPEMRLKLMWAPALIIVGGLLMVGLGPYYEAHWIVFVLGIGLLNLAGPFATAIVLNYAFDCYHPVEPNNKYGPQAITHQAAPYLLSALIISMSMAFGYVSGGWDRKICYLSLVETHWLSL
jgi:hypothetical protein